MYNELISYLHKKSLKRFIKYNLTIPLLKGVFGSIHRCFQILPFDMELMIFQSEGDFSDNSRALYDYLLQNTTAYHFVWLVKERSHFTNTDRTKFVKYSYAITNLKSAWVLARAKYIFYTHGIGDVKRRKGQTIVNLWHGIPIKGLGRMAMKHVDTENPPFDILVSLGKRSSVALCKFVQCSERFAVPLGYPRNDVLIKSSTIGLLNPFVPNGFKGKVVIWMPTFRASERVSFSEVKCDNQTGMPLLDTPESIGEFNTFLSYHQVYVIIKIHHLQVGKDVFKRNFSNVRFLEDDDIMKSGMQLYEIVSKSDALLTDYSSIYFDYLLLDKPIGFIISDISNYENSRGKFIFDDIKSILAGKHISDMDDFRSFFIDIVNGIDIYKSQRKTIKDEFITYQDCYSCNRIVNYLNL